MKATSEIVRLRKQAEEAVVDMPEGDLKVKAFEVTLAYLLAGDEARDIAPGLRADAAPAGTRTKKKDEARQGRPAPEPDETSAKGRILLLKSEGFFKNPRGIGETKEGLAAHGWNYAVTALSGELLFLVQKGYLKRGRFAEGKRQTWKYFNP